MKIAILAVVIIAGGAIFTGQRRIAKAAEYQAAVAARIETSAEIEQQDKAMQEAFAAKRAAEEKSDQEKTRLMDEAAQRHFDTLSQLRSRLGHIKTRLAELDPLK